MVGIGGIGMSALAQLFRHEGAMVSGSDRDESPTTHLLRAAGVEVYIGHVATQVPEDTDLLVYTDAIVEGSEGYAERVKARELGIPELNYFEALGAFAHGRAPFAHGRGHRVVAVAGANGKTTTTAMLAKILIDTGCNPTVVVGSIVSDFHSNFKAGAGNIFVVEACEYKRHFLTFQPSVLVITNIELDHTDYFTDEADYIHAFSEAIDTVEDAGDIVTNPHDANVAKAIAGSRSRLDHSESVGEGGKSVVDYSNVSVLELLVPGEFNRDNARAAKAAAQTIAPHIPERVIDQSLASFRGTWRRFEYKGVLPSGAHLYDDYAHHPSAIEKTIQAAREKFPNKKTVVFFHPHLYSRTRDLFGDFAKALATADEAYILPVYAAREPHDPSVSNEELAKAATKLGGTVHAIDGMEATTKKLKTLGSDTVAFTMGAGDVYRAGEAALQS